MTALVSMESGVGVCIIIRLQNFYVVLIIWSTS